MLSMLWMLTLLKVFGMHTIAVVQQKGGQGKTMLATNIAAGLVRRHVDVTVMDLDPQASARLWFRKRRAAGEEHPEVRTVAPGELTEELHEHRAAGRQVVVLDTHGRGDPVSAHAAELASLILCPLVPRFYDLDSLRQTLERLRPLNRPTFVILNQINPSARRAEEVATAVTEAFGPIVAPVRLHERVAFYDSAAEGLSVEEYEPGGKAAAEMRSLLHWLGGRIGYQVKHAEHDGHAEHAKHAKTEAR